MRLLLILLLSLLGLALKGQIGLSEVQLRANTPYPLKTSYVDGVKLLYYSTPDANHIYSINSTGKCFEAFIYPQNKQTLDKQISKYNSMCTVINDKKWLYQQEGQIIVIELLKNADGEYFFALK